MQGLRGHAIALAPPSAAEKGHKSFQDAIAHFSDLLILEKPPEDPVLTVIEMPAGTSESDLHYLNTIYDKKPDGRYKARTVLSSGKKKL